MKSFSEKRFNEIKQNTYERIVLESIAYRYDLLLLLLPLFLTSPLYDRLCQ